MVKNLRPQVMALGGGTFGDQVVRAQPVGGALIKAAVRGHSQELPPANQQADPHQTPHLLGP